MATYYAMTTENFDALGFTVLGVGASEHEAIEDAGGRPDGTGDMRANTLHKNFRVCSRSAAIKCGWISRRQYLVYDEETDCYVWHW